MTFSEALDYDAGLLHYLWYMTLKEGKANKKLADKLEDTFEGG